LSGRRACQKCGARIDFRDLLVELGTGLLFAALYWRYELSVPLLVYSGYVCIFVVAFMTDIKHRLIPNTVTFPGIVLALPLGFIMPGLGGLSSLLGGVFYGGLFLLFYLVAMAVYRSRVVAFGLGDVKLALVIGLITGLKGAMLSALIGTTIGGFLALVMLLTRRASLQSVMPYGPGLIIGAVLTIIWSPWIV
jgi:leader peptidase (prepilin peptidase)/N-methyltransferase